VQIESSERRSNTANQAASAGAGLAMLPVFPTALAGAFRQYKEVQGERRGHAS
jgi:hypothetical protein